MNDISYISGGSNSEDLQQLKNNQLIKDFASVTPEIYSLIKATNPTLLMMVDLARKIVEA